MNDRYNNVNMLKRNMERLRLYGDLIKTIRSLQRQIEEQEIEDIEYAIAGEYYTKAQAYH